MGYEYDHQYEHQDAREKWVHEDNLVNQRLSWLILSQTILVAAYTLLITADIGKHYAEQVARLIQFVPIFGMVVSVITFLALLAGVIGQYRHKRAWMKAHCGAKSITLEEAPKLLGYLPIYLLPTSFIVAWAWLWLLSYE